MNNKEKSPKQLLAGIALGTAAVVGGITMLPLVAGAQDTDSENSDPENSESQEAEPQTTESEEVEPQETDSGRRHGKRGHRGGEGSEVLTELLGLTAEEIRDARQSGQSLADIAEGEGVSASAVVDALVAEAQSHVAEKVIAGDMTQAEADEKLADIETSITEKVNSTDVKSGGGSRRGHGGSAATLGADVLPDLLGMTQDEIQSALREGGTLADLAESNGVSTDALVGALVDSATEAVEEKLEAGDITAERAEAVLADLDERVEDRVTSERPDRSEGRRGHRR